MIQNGSFEIFDSIDCGSGGFDNAYFSPIPHVLENWYGYQSPDYFNNICTNGPLPNQYGFDIPANFFGYSLAKNGNAYAGLVVYARGGYDKEYIYQNLAQPLQSGKVYCLSFYVNRADRVTYAIKSIGALFSNNLQPVTNGYEINTTPQVVNTSGFISDTTQWTEIQGCFTANGGEQYITIGNFTTNFSTDTLNTNSSNLAPGRETTSYYYIDNITLIDQTTVGISELGEENGFKVYPNPNNGTMQFNYNIAKNAELVIIDITGKALNTYVLDARQKYVNIKEQELNSGIYFYSVRQNNVVLKQDKFVVIK